MIMSITQYETWKALHFIMRVLKQGNNNMKYLAYGTSGNDNWVRSGVLGPYRECQVGALNRVQKRADKFANNTNQSVWEILALRRLVDRIRELFKAYTGGRAWKAIDITYTIKLLCHSSVQCVPKHFLFFQPYKLHHYHKNIRSISLTNQL
jgi:hypothetical protein